jgi:putative phosphoesterase
MKKIGLISDTHGYLDDSMIGHFKQCDEIWHAGDVGNGKVLDALEAIAPLRAVYGNIDGRDVRIRYPEHQRFFCEKVSVWITHIGGYPGRYAPQIRRIINAHPPQLFICGHSHILKVMNDKKLGLLHINPGAAGKHGFQTVRTLVRFTVDEQKIENLQVIELYPR